MNNQNKGYLCALTAAVLWASSGTAGRALLDAGMTPSALVQIRVLTASVVLAVIFLFLDRSLFKVRLKDLGYLVFLGGVIMASVQISYFYTISKLPVMAAILMQYLASILVGIFSMLVWDERFTPLKALALILAFGGCYLTVGGYNLNLLQMNRLGVLSGLASATVYAAYSLAGERAMQRYGPWTVVFYALFFAAVTWQIIYEPFAFLHSSYSTVEWAWLLYIGVVGTLLPYGLYFAAINYIRSTRALITATMEPIFAGIAAWIFLGQSLEPLQLCGVVFVIFSIALLQIQREQDNLSPELIRKAHGREH